MKKILLLLLLKNFITNIKSCPTKCKCTGTTTNCQYEFLTEIPSNIPIDTITLLLDSNLIKSIKRHHFSNLKQLESLTLSSNNIESIDEGTFDDLTQLTTLHLNDNKLSNIKNTTFIKLVNLEHLRLNAVSKVRPLCIEDGTFENLNQLQQLYLTKNNMVRITNATFKGLSNLLVLDLSDNDFQFFSLLAFTHFTTKVKVTLNAATGTLPMCCCQTQRAITSAPVVLSYLCTDNINIAGDIKSRECLDCIIESPNETTCEVSVSILLEKEITSPPPLKPDISSSIISNTRILSMSTVKVSGVSTIFTLSTSTQTSQKIILPSSTLAHSYVASPPPLKPDISSSIISNTRILSMSTVKVSGVSTIFTLSTSTQTSQNIILPSSTLAHSYVASEIPSPLSPFSIQPSTSIVSVSVLSDKEITSPLKPDISSSITIILSSNVTTTKRLLSIINTSVANKVSSSNKKDLESWMIAAIVGGLVALLCFFVLLVHFKKKKDTERRFSLKNEQSEMSNKNNNAGNTNPGFIIEDEPERDKPSAELY